MEHEHIRALAPLTPMESSCPLVWLDLETTGLDPAIRRVLEVGVIVTTPDLVEIDRFHSVVSAFDLRILRDWLRAQLGEHAPDVGGVDEGDRVPRLAGSSVHFDRGFLRRHLPYVDVLFHYRHIDVGALNECARLWWPEAYEKRPAQRRLHRAIPDLEDTLALARHYRDALGFDPC